MEIPDAPYSLNQVLEQPHKKIWHGIVFGLGYGISTMAFCFVLLSSIVIFYAFTNFSSTLGDMTDDEFRQNVVGAFALVLGVCFILALIAGTLGGKTVYRHSSDFYATRRLVISVFAGVGIGLLLFPIGYLGGLILEGHFFPLDSFFGESAFSLYLLFPIIPGILLAFIGELLGTILVFRRLLSKSKTITT